MEISTGKGHNFVMRETMLCKLFRDHLRPLSRSFFLNRREHPPELLAHQAEPPAIRSEENRVRPGLAEIAPEAPGGYCFPAQGRAWRNRRGRIRKSGPDAQAQAHNRRLFLGQHFPNPVRPGPSELESPEPSPGFGYPPEPVPDLIRHDRSPLPCPHGPHRIPPRVAPTPSSTPRLASIPDKSELRLLLRALSPAPHVSSNSPTRAQCIHTESRYRTACRSRISYGPASQKPYLSPDNPVEMADTRPGLHNRR